MQTIESVYSAPGGLHLRPAAEIVRLAQEHGVRVRLIAEDERQADSTSLLALMTLGIDQGSRIRVEIEGTDERRAADRLSELFSQGGGI